MKTAESVLDEYLSERYENHKIGDRILQEMDTEDCIEAMKWYAKEVLVDYDNWKAHKTPDLVKQYIKEKGL